MFYAPHAEAKRLIDSGAIGRPVLIRLRLGTGPAWGGWRDSPAQAGGGLLMDAGVHRIYLALHLFGSDAILRLAGIESLSVGYRDGPALTMFRDCQWSEVPVPRDDWESSVHASVIAYLDAVTAGPEPPVTGADALEAIQLSHRIYDSATILDAGA